MGCDVVRVGLGDRIHLAHSKVARSNTDVVDEVLKIAVTVGGTGGGPLASGLG